METTGVVRRIDELGRIVIPKEIRRTLGIKDGSSLEIYVAKAIITMIFANSAGWIEIPPIVNQLVAPFTLLVNNTAISDIRINIYNIGDIFEIVL